MNRTKEKKKSKRLKRKLQIAMLAVVILQVCVIMGIFWISKTEKELDRNAIQIFSNSVASKSAEVEENMVKWSDIGDYQESIAGIGSRMADESQTGIRELLKDSSARKEFLRQSMDFILQNLRASETNTSFVILDGEENSVEKDSVVLRDTNPQYNSATNKDILVLAGSSELALENGFTLDSLWTPRLQMEEDREFYDDTVKAGNSNPDIEAKELGHWSMGQRMREFDQEQILYVCPLLDENHQVYGVAGIGVTLDYLNQTLGTGQLAGDETSGCFLGMTRNGTEYQTVTVSGNYYKVRLPLDSLLTVRGEEKKDLNVIEFASAGRNTVGIVEKIRLYNTNTPFEGQQWSVIGLLQRDAVYRSSLQFRSALLGACLFSVIISIIGAILITDFILVPIKALMKDIDRMRPGKFKLLGTGIREFDELAGKIEELSDKVYKMGGKVSDIIEMSSLDLGICEYEKKSRMVFCTRKFMEMAELDMNVWEDSYFPEEQFMELIKNFAKKLCREEEEVSIYHFQSETGRSRWLNIKTMDSEEGVLSIIFDVTQDILEKQKIKHERDYDVLTDLNNRRSFRRRVTAILEEGGCGTGVMASWDLDNLKFVNDNFGHDMGDKYICLLAEVMLRNRGENMVMARMSGDEFMVFLYNGEEEEMYRKLEEIHRQFLNEKLALPDGENLSVSASVGMASIQEASGCNGIQRYEELSRYVDFAMYEVKKGKKGGIKRFERETYMKDYVLIQGVGELNRILEERSVRYAFQPIVDVRTKQIFAYEALMRPISNMLRTPDEFLRVAQSQSKLNQVEELTWTEALRQFSMLQVSGKETRLFINSIPGQSLSEKEAGMLIDQYQELLGKVVVELTEGTRIDQEFEEKKRKFCRQWGILCALDDYGSGYSNTDILVSAWFDFVKLDRTLIKNINFTEEKQNLVRSVIEYCRKRQIKVIAEGVEEKAEFEVCVKLGVDYVQGYYLAKPEFEECTTVFEW